jgi:uncharacterized protein
MKVRVSNPVEGQRTFIVVFDTGDEPMQGLHAVARDHTISAAAFSAIGAFERATLGFFEIHRRDYKHIRIEEQVEVLALNGNIAVTADGPKVHAHVVLGCADGTARGGHLIDARVRPTLEVVLVEVPAHLRRAMDPVTGLPLIDLDQPRARA